MENKCVELFIVKYLNFYKIFLFFGGNLIHCEESFNFFLFKRLFLNNVVEFRLCEKKIGTILLILIMFGINLLMHDQKKVHYFLGFQKFNKKWTHLQQKKPCFAFWI
jgi:hypothetical protein